MKRSRFTEQQIAFALKQQDVGTPVDVRPDALSFETEKRRDAKSWKERAESWLVHGGYIESMQERAERAAQRVAVEATQRAAAKAKQGERERRSNAARKNQTEKKSKEAENFARVRKALERLLPGQRGQPNLSQKIKKKKTFFLPEFPFTVDYFLLPPFSLFIYQPPRAKLRTPGSSRCR